MPDNLYLTFTRPPESLSEQEYSGWYEAHIGDALAVKGFEAARRYRVQTLAGATAPAGYTHLAAYQIAGDPGEALQALAAAPAAAGRPAWLDSLPILGLSCTSHGDPAPALADSLYLVFSGPPDGVPDDDYVEFYREHAAENCQVPGFEASWRFRVRARGAAPEAVPSTHLALYQTGLPLLELQANLDAARPANEPNWPDWFAKIAFVPLFATAVSEPRTRP